MPCVMLTFIDESGHPSPKDSCTRPVVVAVCIDEHHCRDIRRQMFNLKRRVVGRPDLELKARKLLTRSTFRRISEKRELVEAFFEWCRNAPITVFAIGMERPTKEVNLPPTHLPNQFRYLLQRVDLLLQGSDGFGVILFDGDGSQYGGLPRRFEGFLHRSLEGQAMQKIADAPYFVDSRITPGIQIADMAAGAIRIYQENELFKGIPYGDPFLSAVGRYYRVLQDKTLNQVTADGYERPGFFWMPESHHYIEETEAPPGETGGD